MAAIIIQKTKATGTSCSFAAPVTAGSTVVVLFAWPNPAFDHGLNSVTDDKGQDYGFSGDGSYSYYEDDPNSIFINSSTYSFAGSVGGVQTVTVDLNGGTADIFLYEILNRDPGGGTGPSNSLDDSDRTTTGSSGGPATTIPITRVGGFFISLDITDVEAVFMLSTVQTGVITAAAAGWTLDVQGQSAVAFKACKAADVDVDNLVQDAVFTCSTTTAFTMSLAAYYVPAGSTGPVTTATIPPAIVTQPQPQTVNEGETATFNVTTTGDALTLQWLKNGIQVGSGASYTTPATVASDNGSRFSVRVSNTLGTVLSDTALLTVIPAPVAVVGSGLLDTAGIIPNDGSYSLMLRLKDNQDLTNVDPNGNVTSPWYSKCILSALAPCSTPNFMKFGGFWNWEFTGKHPDLLFVLKVGIIFFNNDYSILEEHVWQFGDPVNGTNAWVQLPPDQLVMAIPVGASFFRYECLAMVAVIPNGGAPLAVNTGTDNNYATFLFDSLYAIQQSAGADLLPPTGGTGDCTGSSGGTTGGGTGGGTGTGGTGGGGTGNVAGGGGNPSGTATVVSTAGTLSYATVAASGTGPHTIELDWDASPSIPDPVTSFNIYRGISIGAEILIASVAAPTTTYTDTTADATVTYFYYVTAVNIDGESGHLSDVSVYVPLPGGFVEWTWHGVTVFWSDGTTSAPGDGVITQTGLPDGLLFYYFPYYDFATNTVKWVGGGSGDPPAIAFVASTPAEIASQALTGRIPLFPNLSAGTSGGPAGGGF